MRRCFSPRLLPLPLVLLFLAALLFLLGTASSSSVPAALAAQSVKSRGLIDYSQTPWGSSRELVMKKLRRYSGGFAKSEQSENLVAALGSISTRTWRYALKGNYQFQRGRLYRIDITPLPERGGSISRQRLTELYNDLVGHHREDYGQPRLLNAKCAEIRQCRRSEWLLDKGRSILSISEVLEGKGSVTVSYYSVAISEEIAKAAANAAKRSGKNKQKNKGR